MAENKKNTFDLEPNPFEKSFAYKDNNGTNSSVGKTENASTEKSGTTDSGVLQMPSLPAGSNSSTKLPTFTPTIVTPGGRKLPMLGLSPGVAPVNPETPGLSLWNSLINASNYPNNSSDGPAPAGTQQFPNTLQAHHASNSSNSFAHFVNTLKKTGLTPNESNLRSGLTPGGLNLPGTFPGGAPPGISTPGGYFNNTGVPGLSNFMNANDQSSFNNTDPQHSKLNSSLQSHPTTQTQSTGASNSGSSGPHMPRIQSSLSAATRSSSESNIGTSPLSSSGNGSTAASTAFPHRPSPAERNLPPESATNVGVTKSSPKAEVPKPAKGEVDNNDKKIDDGDSSSKKRKRDAAESPSKKQKSNKVDKTDLKVPRPKKENKDSSEDEKRKNFLERNRVAASKCRQRKKQLVQRMEEELTFYSSGYRELSAQVSQLRDQLVTLKGVIVGHKECPMLASSVGGYEQLNNILYQSNFVTQVTSKSHTNISSMPSTIPTTLLNSQESYSIPSQMSSGMQTGVIRPRDRDAVNEVRSGIGRNLSSETVVNGYNSNQSVASANDSEHSNSLDVRNLPSTHHAGLGVSPHSFPSANGVLPSREANYAPPLNQTVQGRH